MFKKICTILLTFCLFCGCSANVTSSEGEIFKSTYEEYNGQIREKDGKTIRTISIPEDNPMSFSSAEEVLEKIENKDSFIIYFGFPTCPWCRSVLPTFIECAKEANIQTVYYVDVEDIRDTLILDKENNVKVEKEGDEEYLKLVEILADVLDDYVLKDDQEQEINTGHKRIYAPNFVYIHEGKPIVKIEGQSSLQSDAYMELSEEMIQDMKNQFEEFFKTVQEASSACDVKC